MPDLRELVARAICDAAQKRFQRSSGGATANQSAWLEQADAVFAALAPYLPAPVEGDLINAVMGGPDVGCLVLDNRPHGQAKIVLGKDDVRQLIGLMAPLITADAERRVRADLAKQMREDAEANRKLGNVDAASIFADIANDLETDHAG